MRWPSRWPDPALLIVVLVWGVNFPMVKLAYHGFTPAAAAALRCVGQLPVMFAVLALLGRPLRVARPYRRGVFFGGLLGSGVYMILFLEGLARTSSSQGAIALATAPVFVALVSSFLGHERLTARALVGSVLAFGGVTVAEIGSKGVGDGGTLGTAMCVLSALVWAVSVGFLREPIDNQDPMTVFAWSLVPAVAVLVPYGGQAVARTDFSRVAPEGWTGLAYMILVAGVGGFTFYYLAIARSGAAKTSLVSYVIPIVAAFAAWPLLALPPHPAHLVGLALVLTGVWVATGRRKPTATPPAEGQSKA